MYFPNIYIPAPSPKVTLYYFHIKIRNITLSRITNMINIQGKLWISLIEHLYVTNPNYLEY